MNSLTSVINVKAAKALGLDAPERTFEAVQNKLTEQWLHRKQKNQVMLVRYRYYMSAP